MGKAKKKSQIQSQRYRQSQLENERKEEAK